MKIKEEFQSILTEIAQGKAATLQREIDGAVYTRRFVPDARLLLLGGGHISHALCKMASMLDFSVTVVDDRPSFANKTRFPDAAEVICDSFPNAIAAFCVRPTDYVCVVTRGHRFDGQCLRALLSGTFPSYLGMIGSHHRVEGMRKQLTGEGYSPSLLEQLHAPIGLAIGAVTPAEIAVSICAELVQHRRAGGITADGLPQTNTDLSMLRFLAEGKGKKALLLVLSSTGSTPVKGGAIMAIDALGNGYGTIGGGCGEAAAMQQARRLLGSGQMRVIEVNMDNDLAAEDGMVCGGRLRILVQDASENEDIR